MTKSLRIAVVGFGLVGRQHVTALQSATGVKLAAVVEPNRAAHDGASALGVPVLTDLEALAEVPVDGVILATPTPMHVTMALTCIANGWPTLIEKPIAVTSDEAKQIVAASQKAGVPVLVGHHRRYNSIVTTAKAALEDGAVGAIRAVQCTCWLYKPDDYFDAAPWRKKPGAGPISVNLVHDVDLLRHFCGEVASVHAVTAPAVRGYDNEDLAAAVLTFASGAVGTLSVSDSVAAPWSWELTSGENPAYPKTTQSCYQIGGTQGGLSIPDLRIWRHEGDGGWWSPMEATTLPHTPVVSLVAQVEHFAEVIRGKAAPRVSAIEGTRSLAVVEAVDRSARTGKTIQLAPAD